MDIFLILSWVSGLLAFILLLLLIRFIIPPLINKDKNSHYRESAALVIAKHSGKCDNLVHSGSHTYGEGSIHDKTMPAVDGKGWKYRVLKLKLFLQNKKSYVSTTYPHARYHGTGWMR